jgi:hypothetical protein
MGFSPGQDHIAAGAHRDLGGNQLGGHAAAAEAGDRIPRHRFDFRRDRTDFWNMAGGRIASGIGGI